MGLPLCTALYAHRERVEIPARSHPLLPLEVAETTVGIARAKGAETTVGNAAASVAGLLRSACGQLALPELPP